MGENEKDKSREREARRKRERGGGKRKRGRWKRSGEMGHEGFMPLAVVRGWIASRAA